MKTSTTVKETLVGTGESVGMSQIPMFVLASLALKEPTAKSVSLRTKGTVMKFGPLYGFGKRWKS